MGNKMVYNVAIIGSSGTIGSSFTRQLSELYTDANIHAFSRNETKTTARNIVHHMIDYKDEASIEQAASLASKEGPLDIVIVATGILYDNTIMPEKSLRDLSTEKFMHLFAVNTILPALIAKHFLPKLNRQTRSVFTALSARVGSISDNRLGGWYAYRASKSGLNMIIKNAAIEISRQNKNAIIVGLHPGTVNSNLSKPFQDKVPDGKLFTSDYSVKRLLGVLDNLTPESNGKCFSWDGKEVEP
jgi:NAD(P)-dependent dehydrogenase (short-subunit alcohol dehydrogenase family)